MSQKHYYGIHTFAIHVPWKSYADVQNVIDTLVESKKIQIDSKYGNRVRRTFKSEKFWEEGIRIEGQQDHGFNNGLRLIVNPSVILAQAYDPFALARLDADDAETVREVVEELLHQLNKKQPKSPCTISRIDFTCDILCDRQQELDVYLQLFHRCNVNDKYKIWTFQGENTKETNAHSCALLYKEGKRKSKQRTLVKLYDKAWEAEQRGHKSEEPYRLRLEYTMPRKELLKKMPINPSQKGDADWLESNFDKILTSASDHSWGVIEHLLAKQFPCTGKHRLHKKAQERIEKLAPKKYKSQMLRLLKNGSDCKNLGTALAKMKLTYKQRHVLLAQFDAIDTHPICLPKGSNAGAIASFHGQVKKLGFYRGLDEKFTVWGRW